MKPLTNHPTIRLLLIDLKARAPFINKLSASISCADRHRFPSCIVGIGWKCIDAEWIGRDVELKLRGIEIHARTGVVGGVYEDRIGRSGAGMPGFYFGGVSCVWKGKKKRGGVKGKVRNLTSRKRKRWKNYLQTHPLCV